MFLKKLLAGSFAATGFAAAPGNSLAQSITPIKVDQGLARTEPVRKNFLQPGPGIATYAAAGHEARVLSTRFQVGPAYDIVHVGLAAEQTKKALLEYLKTL